MKLIGHAAAIAAATSLLHAQDANLAQKLADPISDLISLPIQTNYDFGIGAVRATARSGRPTSSRFSPSI